MAPSPPPHFATSRRGFLRLAGSATALAALARIPAVPAAARAAAREPNGGRFFDPDATRVLTAVVERMVHDGDPAAPALAGTRAIATIDALCGALDPALTEPLPLLLRLVEWGPPLFDLRFSRFTRLDAEGRDAALRGWMTSRFGVRRMGFGALRNLSMLGWYSQEESWPAIGYAGPLLARQDPA